PLPRCRRVPLLSDFLFRGWRVLFRGHFIFGHGHSRGAQEPDRWSAHDARQCCARIAADSGSGERIISCMGVVIMSSCTATNGYKSSVPQLCYEEMTLFLL